MKTINNEFVIGNPNLANNKIEGSLTVSGLFSATESSDKYIVKPFSTNMTFDLSEGMFYNIIDIINSNTTLYFKNISNTSQSTYIFSFLLNSQTYIIPAQATINIIFNAINYSCPVYGTISLPTTTFTYLIQQLMIVNISSIYTPKFICFNSVSSY